MDAHTTDADPLERLGIIGVGEIGRAIVEGLCEGRDRAPKVFLSPRGADVGAELRRRYPTVRICADNQEVADHAAVVILAVRPQDRTEALTGLSVGEDKVVISALAGVGLRELGDLLDSTAPLVRAIPMPAVRERSSVTVTFPYHPTAKALFDRLGGTLSLPEEDTFNVYSALTGTISSHYGYLASLMEWATRHGVSGEDASRYIRSQFRNVGQALSDESRSLPQLAAGHETPNGSNERIRTTWLDAQNLNALHAALDGLLADLRRQGG